MSNRYKGGVISATPPTLVAGAGASGAWTLEQQMQATAAGLWPVNGPFYIEDVFGTYLYTGNGSTQTITNGINLSGSGGLVWCKSRSTPGYSPENMLFDTSRGANYPLYSNDSSAPGQYGSTVTAFNSTGFNVGANLSQSAVTYASWTFRKQPKFFDTVTWTGDGVSGRTISHSLGSSPGVVIIKRTDTTGDWKFTEFAVGSVLRLNTTDAASTSANLTGGYCGGASSTTLTLTAYSSSLASVNAAGGTYVAYIYASNAGGFGLSGTDNVISCGYFTATGSDLSVNLGYEAQWVLIKNISSAEDWYLLDTYRGMTLTTWGSKLLRPNTTGAESGTSSNWIFPSATGFTVGSSASSGNAYIYIAIRKGPMKVPTDATTVFTPVIYSGDGTTNRVITTNIVTDLFIGGSRNNTFGVGFTQDRIRGQANLSTFNTNAEAVDPNTYPKFDVMTGVNLFNANGGGYNASGTTYVRYAFRRAPGFFDEVCANVTSAVRTYSHGLQAVPELLICKRRDGVEDWITFRPNTTGYLSLNRTDALQTTISATATSTTFTLPSGAVDYASPYVFYLFATLAGVSKVGSYTGTGATQTIACGFTGGARFVLIKRTDSTGDWYVWDTARGMTAGTDPNSQFNTTNAETNTNSVYTATGGFQIVSTAAGINASGGAYIFLAIA